MFLPSAEFCPWICADCENMSSEIAEGRNSVSYISWTFTLAYVGLLQAWCYVLHSTCSLLLCRLFSVGTGPEIRSVCTMHAVHSDPKHQAAWLPKYGLVIVAAQHLPHNAFQLLNTFRSFLQPPSHLILIITLWCWKDSYYYSLFISEETDTRAMTCPRLQS